MVLDTKIFASTVEAVKCFSTMNVIFPFAPCVQINERYHEKVQKVSQSIDTHKKQYNKYKTIGEYIKRVN